MLAVTTAQRLESMPNVPTIAQAGFRATSFTGVGGYCRAPPVRRRRSSIACTPRSSRSRRRPRPAPGARTSVQRRCRWRAARGPLAAPGARRVRPAGRGHPRYRPEGCSSNPWRLMEGAPQCAEGVATTPTARAGRTASLLLISGHGGRHACGGHRAQRRGARCGTRGDMPARFVLRGPDSQSTKPGNP